MAANKKANKKAAKKKGRQPRLPGMPDAKLEALHEAALSYADIRDQRQELRKQESDLKKDLLRLMHKHKKDHYEYNGVVVDLVVEEETVKVRVKKHKDDDETEPVEDVNVSAPSPEGADSETEEDFDPDPEEEDEEIEEGESEELAEVGQPFNGCR